MSYPESTPLSRGSVPELLRRTALVIALMAPFQLQCRFLALSRRAVALLRSRSASVATACLLLAIAAHVVFAQAPGTPGTTIVLTQEPITPIPPPPPADPLKLTLGEELFQSRLLSHDRMRSCVSCHDVRSNGADGWRYAVGSDGKPLEFNTPSVFNAAFSFRLDWEGNERTLEDQATLAIDSGPGLGSSMPEVLARLNANADFVKQFIAAYGRNPDESSLIDALATYERSLVTPDSPFDRWLKGDKGALSAAELNGYALFKSFGCVSCHQGVNVGGNMFERQGVFHPLASPKPEVLRVPSLRNVATTAPYFHDGSAATLTDAVRKMADAQLDQTLSDQEIDAIVTFLGSLTGKYLGVPVKAAVR
jgi:cytochrome c peroxidase